MKQFDPSPESTFLSGKTTIGRYREMVRSKDRAGIANLVRGRFEERYLSPVLGSPTTHGFAVLAICCLMVEALESFRKGWARTDGKREVPFRGFFRDHDSFHELQPIVDDFYRNVRCGILHQAETTNGWRVRRGPGLLEQRNGIRWISASEFATRLRDALNRYCEELRTSGWEMPIWTNARKKLDAICRNSGVSELTTSNWGISDSSRPRVR